MNKLLVVFFTLSLPLISFATDSFQVNVSAVRVDNTHEVTLCTQKDQSEIRCEVLGHYTTKQIKSGILKQKLKKYGSVGAISGAAIVAGAGAIAGGFLVVGPLYGASALTVYGTYGAIGVVGAGAGAGAANSFSAIRPKTYRNRVEVLNEVMDLMNAQGGQVVLTEEQVDSLLKGLPKK